MGQLSSCSLALLQQVAQLSVGQSWVVRSERYSDALLVIAAVYLSICAASDRFLRPSDGQSKFMKVRPRIQQNREVECELAVNWFKFMSYSGIDCYT